MARKCGNCGAPAPDTNSRFCDLCGAPLIEEPVAPQGLPVCPACGTIVSDRKAQFCDVCGTPLAKPVCPVCGTPAPSSRSKFCTRCGATFGPPIPGKNRAGTISSPAAAEPEPEPVVVRSRKGRIPEPGQAPQENSPEEWDPWTDGDPLYDVSAPLPLQPQQRPLTDLERIAAGVPRPKPAKEHEAQQPGGQQKKYAHLPLVADELREDAERRRSAYDTGESKGPSGHKGKLGKKGGIFKF
jgi:hypothetical protein